MGQNPQNPGDIPLTPRWLVAMDMDVVFQSNFTKWLPNSLANYS
jgi:hypothetical protein